MSKIKYLLITILLFYPLLTKATVTNSEIQGKLKVYLLASDDCKNCIEAKEYLQKEADKNYYLEMVYSESNALYLDAKKKLNIKKDELPLIIIGSNYYQGFNAKIVKKLTKIIDLYGNNDYCDILNTELSVKECQKINKNIYNNHNYLVYLIIPLVVITIGSAILIVLKRKKNSK